MSKEGFACKDCVAFHICWKERPEYVLKKVDGCKLYMPLDSLFKADEEAYNFVKDTESLNIHREYDKHIKPWPPQEG